MIIINLAFFLIICLLPTLFMTNYLGVEDNIFKRLFVVIVVIIITIGLVVSGLVAYFNFLIKGEPFFAYWIDVILRILQDDFL